MAFCGNCGAQVEGSFCGSCGKPAGGAPAPGPAPASTGATTGGLQTNVAAALCYLAGLITGILFLVLEPYSKDRAIRFHAFQSIFFNLGVFVIYLVLSIFGTVIGMVIPLAGAALVGIVSLLVWLGSVVLWLFLMLKAYNGAKIVLPVIGPLAEKQAG